MTCKKFKLEPNPTDSEEPCPDEYLEITDGTGGYQKFCGESGPVNLTTKNGFRDLYVTLQTNSKKQSRGLKCTVDCSVPDAEATTPLEDNFSPDRDEFCNCGRKPVTPMKKL